MLLSASVVAGLLLVFGLVGLRLALRRAERRARLTLGQALCLPADAIERLMAGDGDLQAEIALARRGRPSEPLQPTVARPNSRSFSAYRGSTRAAPDDAQEIAPASPPAPRPQASGKPSSLPD